MNNNENLLEVTKLRKYFPIKGVKGPGVQAVQDVSFAIKKGETLGLVGESGCGKSTLSKTLIRLYKPDDGKIMFDQYGDLALKEGAALTKARRDIQMVYQDPYSSLNPRMTVSDIVGEPLDIHHLYSSKKERDEKIAHLLNLVGLNSDHARRYAHEFSGGQRQRICIARALALNPEFVVCDEPVSALDVSIQAQIINLLKELQDKYNLTYLFISHDLSVVEHISDTVGVMYLGNLVEYGATPDIFSHPLHPYTKALFSAIPIPDPTIRRERIVLQGSIPSPANPPKGCKFHTRCPYATERCKTEVPQQREVEPGHYVVCHLYEK